MPLDISPQRIYETPNTRPKTSGFYERMGIDNNKYSEIKGEKLFTSEEKNENPFKRY